MNPAWIGVATISGAIAGYLLGRLMERMAWNELIAKGKIPRPFSGEQ